MVLGLAHKIPRKISSTPKNRSDVYVTSLFSHRQPTEDIVLGGIYWVLSSLRPFAGVRNTTLINIHARAENDRYRFPTFVWCLPKLPQFSPSIPRKQCNLYHRHSIRRSRLPWYTLLYAPCRSFPRISYTNDVPRSIHVRECMCSC